MRAHRRTPVHLQFLLQVLCVAFHPIYSSLVSGGEDTTIKVRNVACL